MKRTSAVLGALTAAAALVLTALGTPVQAQTRLDPATEWSNYEKITLTKNVGEPTDRDGAQLAAPR
jgi:hypothetical protein